MGLQMAKLQATQLRRTDRATSPSTCALRHPQAQVGSVILYCWQNIFMKRWISIAHLL